MIQIQVTKQTAEVLATEPVVSGSVNAYLVDFRLDESWDGLSPTAVFQAGGTHVSVVLDGTTCPLPWEVLARENIGFPLYVGLYGVSGTDIVVPTIWATVGTIRAGAELGDNTQPPTPDVYQQYVAEVKADAEIAAAAVAETEDYSGLAAEKAAVAVSAANVATDAATRSENARDTAVGSAGTAAAAAQTADQAATRAETAKTAAESARATAETAAGNAGASAGAAASDATLASTSATLAIQSESHAKTSETNAKASESAAVQAARDSVAAWNQIKNQTVVTAERTYPTAPQITITVEEAVQAIAVTDIGGVPIQQFNFTEMRFYCENVPQSAADSSELRVALNRSSTGMYTAATDFLVSTRTLFTGGGVSLADGIAWTATPQTNRAWRGDMNAQVYPFLEYGRVVRSVNFWSNNSLIPVGTKIQVWLR